MEIQHSNKNSIVKIINANIKSIDVAAASGRISTKNGSALSIFNSSENNSNNLNLIKKVLSSGHKSLIEHITFNIAFNNVSAFVEQFIIEYRLASFTVQSRRYVDFRDVGFFIDESLPDIIKIQYENNMVRLFNDYTELVELGIPKEDARFVLPYCFFSNFYCTCNARELVHIICDMLYGKGRDFKELSKIGNSLKQQFDEIIPDVIEQESKKYKDSRNSWSDFDFQQIYTPTVGQQQVDIISKNSFTLEDIIKHSDYFTNYPQKIENIFANSSDKRYLELITYCFKIKNLSLSALTHLARHRMQTLIVPNIANAVHHNKYVLPKTIKENDSALKIYSEAFKRNCCCVNKLISLGLPIHSTVYFALSGNTIDVISSMNARELFHYINLRSCHRAQWEIRDLTISMLNLLRSDDFDLFINFGPSCYTNGICPEGKMSCGQINEVKKFFREQL